MGKLLSIFTNNDNENESRQQTRSNSTTTHYNHEVYSPTYRRPINYGNGYSASGTSTSRQVNGHYDSYSNSTKYGRRTSSEHMYRPSVRRSRQITLYHYTTIENASQIIREKLVRSSTMSTPWKYRQHGCGVYFTSLSPNVDPTFLALNNFTNGGDFVSNGLRRKIRGVVQITFDEEDVEKINARSRDIYLYRGTINLRNYEGRYKIFENTNYVL